MALRMINYGYEMINGLPSIVNEEAEIVKEIFRRYGEGDILLAIATDLTERGVVFYQEKNVWTKSMIARIIDNRHYVGDEGYPRIINDEDFKRAYELKSQKGVKKPSYSEKIQYLKSHSVCAQCGNKMYRHGSWSIREKWFCASGCKNDIYIGDQELMDSIIKALKCAKENEEYLVTHSDNAIGQSSLDVVRQTNEIKRLMEQSEVPFDMVKKMIFQCAASKFTDYPDNEVAAYTEYVRRAFDEWEPCGTFDIAFWGKLIEEIAVKRDGSVVITFINKADVKGGI